MKCRFLCLLCLVLALLMPVNALAEGLSGEAEGVLSQEQPEAFVNEFEMTLDDLAFANDEAKAEAPQEQATEEAGVPSETEVILPEPTSEPEPVSPLGEAMDAKVLKITKSAGKTVYLGIPYVLNVKGGIKSVSSSAKKVATASKDGVLTLKKTGKAKLTVKTGKGKKFTVTLTVNPTPAPENAKVRAKDGRMTLSWDAAKYATGYLIQQSANGSKWQDYAVAGSPATSLDVTGAVTGPTWFRVTAILGDAYGGTSKALSLLNPLTGVKVICQEDYYNGPTDRMNVVWDACDGVECFEVYHTLLPSQDYRLIGTTTENWFAVTRTKTGLDAYKVKPVSGIVDLPASDPVTLWTGLQENVLPPEKLTSSSGIILVVNKKAQVVTAYVQDEFGKYTLPLRHMICSSGKVYDRTKNGTYTLKSRKGEWYQYPSGCYIRWPSIYRDGYYFHSPLYKASKSLMGGTVDKLGTRQSLGCVRLKVRDAEWIYRNCPKGTAVYICDGQKKDSLKKAIKPQTVKVKGF